MTTDRVAFRAVLWKELRENLKWAVLGLLFVSVGAFLIFRGQVGESAYGGSLRWTLFSSGFFRFTPFLTAAVGLMIGIAQVVLENRGDRWGFLTHRPMKRSTLFLGKAVAGILLYLVAVGVPLLCAAVWVALPGHLPMPTDPHMVLPLIADILSGLVYYFAGVLTGMREARWYASRVAGLGIGISCSYLISIVPEFWQAVACCAVCISISSASAWGTFVEGGRFASQPWLTRFATALCIGAGLFIAGDVVFNVGASFLPRPAFDSVVTRFVIAGDGEIVQADYDDDTIVEVRNLQGTPIERYRNPEGRGAQIRGVISAYMPGPGIRNRWNGDYRSTTQFFRAGQSTDQLLNGETVSWYYIPRLGRIAAYQNRSAKLIGWMGPGGFTSGADMPEDRFERPLTGKFLQNLTFITFENAVYRLDLWRRHITKIFVADPGEAVIGASDSAAADREKAFVAISTTKRTVIQSRDGATQLSAVRDIRSNQFSDVIVSRTLLTPEPQTFIWYTNAIGAPAFVEQYGSAGTAVADYTLPNLLTVDTLTWGDLIYKSVLDNLALRALLWKRSVLNFSSFRYSTGQHLVWWMIPFLEGVLVAGLAYTRGRRYAFSSRRLGLWTAISFALGPLGYVLMLSLLEWPAFENCPECGRSRLVTRENCEHCREPFLTPDFDGTEVFEPIVLN